MRSSSLAYSASGFGLLTIALCMSLGMAGPVVRLLSDPAIPSCRDGGLNGIENILGQNNPERDGAATPPRPVSRGPGLACAPRMGRVPGASLSGSSVSGEKCGGGGDR